MLPRLILAIAFLSTLPALADDAAEHEFCQKYLSMNDEMSAKDGKLADGCGQNGYLVAFGNRFCNVFVTKNTSFTPAGQKAMYNIRHCLIEGLEKTRNQLTCDKVKRVGINSHYGCYMQSGFCQMPVRDKMMVYYLLKSQALTMDAISNGFSINGGCAVQNYWPGSKKPTP